MRLSTYAAALGTVLLSSSFAHADSLDSCGDFFFVDSASVDCEVIIEGGCVTACEPVAFQVQCASELTLECDGECDVDADVECTTSCEASCVTECEGGNFDCNASCSGSCNADCSSRCAGSENSAQCEASCEASCDAECSASCEGTGPSCESQCEGSCEGQCTAEVNAECQVECQAEGFSDCEAELQGGCETQCEEPEGALFCNDQFVDTDDFDACIAEIEASFDVTVTGYLEGECSGNQCNVEAGCSTDCSTAPGRTSSDFSIGMLVVGLAGMLGAAGRRMTRTKSASKK